MAAPSSSSSTPARPGVASLFRPSPTFSVLDGLSTASRPRVQSVGASCSCGWRPRRASRTATFQQTLVVVRHSERRDHVDKKYFETEDGLAWPEDAPLTEHGVDLARDVAEELAELHQEAHFVAVATSPYRRCMQTSAEIAKRLQLPVLIDQELGEVRDALMPKHDFAHRSPKELPLLAKELGMKLLNPRFRRGDLKLFGKRPPWPETLEGAKRRFIVRIENYIRQSADTQGNIILVTHADALAGVLMMFEREGVQVQGVDFCGRIIARRTVKYHEKEEASKGSKAQPALVKRLFLTPAQGVYADAWSIECRSVMAESTRIEALARYHEKLYLETCEETSKLCQARDARRSRGDDLFDRVFRKLRVDGTEHLPPTASLDTAVFRSEGMEDCAEDPTRNASSASILWSSYRSNASNTVSPSSVSRRPSRLALDADGPGCLRALRRGCATAIAERLPRCFAFLQGGGQLPRGAFPYKSD